MVGTWYREQRARLLDACSLARRANTALYPLKHKMPQEALAILRMDRDLMLGRPDLAKSSR